MSRYFGKAVSASFVLSLLAHVPELASGHSWVEQAKRISPEGTLVDPTGYPGQWYGRDSPEFNDQAVTNLLDAENSKLCTKQPLGDQVDDMPVLTAAPGDFIALRYTENGHVTLIEDGRPENRGTVYVYGTTEPRDDEDVVDVFKQWTPDGTGGDGRGRLLATRHYDDGQCFEANDSPISQERQEQFPKEENAEYGPNLWCQTDLQIPDDVPEGTQYAIYWVWTWPLLHDAAGTENGQYGDYGPGQAPPGGEHLEDEGVVSGEVYSSCISVNIEGEPLMEAGFGSESLGSPFSAKFVDDHDDWNDVAVREQLENLFQVDTDGASGDPERDIPEDDDAENEDEDEGEDEMPEEGDGDAPVVTVTVTAEPTTVYATATATADPGTEDPGMEEPEAPQDDVPEDPEPADLVETVEPFMKLRNLRARGSWNFGNTN